MLPNLAGTAHFPAGTPAGGNTFLPSGFSYYIQAVSIRVGMVSRGIAAVHADVPFVAGQREHGLLYCFTGERQLHFATATFGNNIDFFHRTAFDVQSIVLNE